MTEVQIVNGFEEFSKLLKSLCLNEFPCGYGSWRPRLKGGKGKKELIADSSDQVFSITTKDYGAEYEKTEALEELLHSDISPWCTDFDWSAEAEKLRDIAVRSPWLINQSFILEYFKSLKLIDKQITEVDENFTVFVNLEDLQLGGNKLQTVNSKNLPRKLQTLELCANEISNLADLAIDPPALTHLGLGYNNIHMLEDYLSGDIWPQLRSVDLSHNNLCDLVDVIKKLQTLPLLKNLVLRGNPLCLVPGYRGFTVDTLRNLNFLDEREITVETRSLYRGLARRRELMQDVAKFYMRVDFIKGILPPEEIKNSEDLPEFPIINRRYFVRFMFPEDKKGSEDLFNILKVKKEEKEDGTVISQKSDGSVKTGSGSAKMTPDLTKGSKSRSPSPHSTKSRSPRDTSPRGDRPAIKVTRTSAENLAAEKKKVPKKRKTPGGECSVPLAPVDTEKSAWAEEIPLVWTSWVKRRDLMGVKKFLQHGLNFALMEELTISYPTEQDAPPMPGPTIPKPAKKDEKKKGKDSKGAKSANKSPSKKADVKKSNLLEVPTKAKANKRDAKDVGKKDSKKAPGKDDKKGAAGSEKGKKGKKGEPEVEMTTTPPEYHCLTHFHIPLESFLEGTVEYHNIFKKKYLEGVGYVKPKKGYLNNPPASRKPPEPKVETPEPKGKKGSPKKEKKGKEDEEPVEAPPPKLEIHLALHLHQWKNAIASVQDDVVLYSDSEGEEEMAASSGDEYYQDPPSDRLDYCYDADGTLFEPCDQRVFRPSLLCA